MEVTQFEGAWQTFRLNHQNLPIHIYRSLHTEDDKQSMDDIVSLNIISRCQILVVIVTLVQDNGLSSM
jgi:hypothetical protein